MNHGDENELQRLNMEGQNDQYQQNENYRINNDNIDEGNPENNNYSNNEGANINNQDQVGEVA